MPEYRWVIDSAHPAGHLVVMTAEEEAQLDEDQAVAATRTLEEAARRTRIMTLAQAIEDGTATPTQQRRALALCVRQLLVE